MECYEDEDELNNDYNYINYEGLPDKIPCKRNCKLINDLKNEILQLKKKTCIMTNNDCPEFIYIVNNIRVDKHDTLYKNYVFSNKLEAEKCVNFLKINYNDSESIIITEIKLLKKFDLPLD